MSTWPAMPPASLRPLLITFSSRQLRLEWLGGPDVSARYDDQ